MALDLDAIEADARECLSGRGDAPKSYGEKLLALVSEVRLLRERGNALAQWVADDVAAQPSRWNDDLGVCQCVTCKTLRAWQEVAK